MLLIPHSICCQILPNPNISVLELLQFPLPVIHQSVETLKHTSVHEFLSHKQPSTNDLEFIRAIPVPGSKELLKELGEEYQCMKEKATSVKVSLHAGTVAYLPVWDISFWIEALKLQYRHRKPWLQAEGFINSHGHCHIGSRNLIQQIYSVLGLLPWGGKIRSLENMVQINHLTTYVSQDWFSDDHEDLIVNLLQCALHRHCPMDYIELRGSLFHCCIRDAYCEQESYHIGRRYQYLKDPTLMLLDTKGSIAFIANINNQHWIAIVSLTEELKAVLTWWTYTHTGSKFDISTLHITQQLDPFSCGLLAINALEHYFLPDKYPLINALKVDESQLQMLLNLTKWHLDNIQSFETEAVGYQFTFTVSDHAGPDDSLSVMSVSSPPQSYVLLSSPPSPPLPFITDKEYMDETQPALSPLLSILSLTQSFFTDEDDANETQQPTLVDLREITPVSNAK
ncbi:hypothetical protein BDQ17DRAFT_1425621 [Cyathus striatus]|nr:hypothetical protein BDQ17DRAFT_1425621 [Cyathus striatus]